MLCGLKCRWRTWVVVGALTLALSSMFAADFPVEDYYYDFVAPRASGSYATNGVVYFHIQGTEKDGANADLWRVRVMRSTQRMMCDWISCHANANAPLSDENRRLLTLCNRLGPDVKATRKLSVHGRGFSLEGQGFVAYGLAVQETDLMCEARKGPLGESEDDIVARWRAICEQAVDGGQLNRILQAVDCPPLKKVSPKILNRGRMEMKLVEGLREDSPAVRLLLMEDEIDIEREDVWISGLQVIEDLNSGHLSTKDALPRLLEAIDETPGSAALWCHLGRCLTERKLYALAILSYKNAFCLSCESDMLALLRCAIRDLAHAYEVLGFHPIACPFRLLSKGL